MIVGSLDLLTELVAPLVSGFAVAEGYTFSEEFIADDHIIWRLSDTETDQMVARIEALSDARRPDLGVRRGEPDEGALADVIALDALVVVVSPENDLALMPVETLRSLRLTVGAVVADRGIGRFSLLPHQALPTGLFVPLAALQEALDQEGRANALLVGRRPAGPDGFPKSDPVA